MTQKPIKGICSPEEPQAHNSARRWPSYPGTGASYNVGRWRSSTRQATQRHEPPNETIQNVKKGTTRSSISIGENCWIGAKVTVLAGVNIGDNCVIAAGSVVTKDFPSNSVLAGVPARVLKKRV